MESKLSLICGIVGTCLIILGVIFDFVYPGSSKAGVSILIPSFQASGVVSLAGFVLGLSANKSRNRLIGTILSIINLIIVVLAALTPVFAAIWVLVMWNMSTGGA